MITKDEILGELNYDTVSFRDGDGDWFEGIDSKDFDGTADRLVKLFNIPNVSNRRELFLKVFDMKLILCKNCQDVVRLMQDEERFCKCGKCSGKYTDDLNAWYKGGEFVVPLGFANGSLVKAVHNQPKEGWGENFSAFVIPESCDTFKNCS